MKIKYKLKKFFKENRGFTLSILFIVLLLCYVAIPTLSDYKNTNPTYSINVWDGLTASSYGGGDGKKESPYIISNGNELAYFALNLETTDYEGEYFILKNDIVLNDGIFSYTKNDGIRYLKDGDENIVNPGLDNDLIKVFQHLNNFKGTFDGDFHTIYGLYIDKSVDGQNGLFTNLEGNVSNLYIRNSVIYGGNIVGGVASKALNSSLTNISYNGFVVSNEEIASGKAEINLDDIFKNVTDSGYTDNLDIVNLGYIPGIVTSICLSGVYENKTTNSNAVLKINGEVINDGEFELNLGADLLTNISIDYQTDIASEFSLTNLMYKVNYSYSNASGIVSIAENSNLENIINKAMVSAPIYASSIVNNVVGKTTLKNAYNTGIIESDNTSSGLISIINFNVENVDIINCYNNGNLVSNNSAMIGNIENNVGDINLVNVFNTLDNYMINKVELSNVNVDGAYVLSNNNIKYGDVNGDFVQTNLENLKTKSFVQTYLKYGEYDGTLTNALDVWIWMYEQDALPILYIDELNQPIANIHINDYVWNSYNKEIETLKFADKLVFSIEEASFLNPIKEIYYYISNEKNILSKTELDGIANWNKYEDIIEINEEGIYVIYSKIIDSNNNQLYINSDLLLIDLTGSDITITSSYSDDVWKEFNTNINNYYINESININIFAEDSLSGIDKIYYYLSDEILSETDLENINKWDEYVSSIEINDEKTIVYAKVVDNCNYITYANSDVIIFNGYNLVGISPGMNGVSKDNLYITNKSSVSLSFNYKDSNEYAVGSKHQLISNVLLPVNTKITLIDKVNNKVYVYITEDIDYGYSDCLDDICFAKYDFEFFNEVGTKNKFSENNYTGEINENFVVLVDFVDSLMDKNIENISLTLKMDNDKKNEIRNTLVSSNKVFNVIFGNNDALISLSSSFNDIIKYNENSQYIVDFSTKLNYKTFNGNKIIDTTLEDKNIGLSIKMVDNKGLIVDKDDLKNIEFKIGETKYSPYSDGIVKINLESGINDIVDNIVIQTYSDNYTLEQGEYKFIISLYVSYDGIFSNEYLSSFEIPVFVSENVYNIVDGFNVIMNKDDKIISKKENEFNFEILVSNANENTDVRVSLYKKNDFSPIDQKYTIIDLGEYVNNISLDKVSQNTYYALKEVVLNNKFNISLNTGLLEKNGYMFVFELYEDGKFVNKITKKFIVK